MVRTPRRNLMLMTLILSAIGILLVSSPRVSGQDAKKQLLLSAGPYRGPRYQSIPVQVFSVTSGLAEGRMTVTSVVLKNQSTKSVSAVKIHWFVKKQDNLSLEGDALLLDEGDTSLLDIDISPGGEQTLDHPPIVTFKEIFGNPTFKKSYEDRTLTGLFLIDIMVGEIIYADGSTWSTRQ